MEMNNNIGTVQLDDHKIVATVLVCHSKFCCHNVRKYSGILSILSSTVSTMVSLGFEELTLYVKLEQPLLAPFCTRMTSGILPDLL